MSQRYRLTSPAGRTMNRTLTPDEVQQFKQAGFEVEEVQKTDPEPNRADWRRSGMRDGSRRMPKRLASRKVKKK